MKRFFISALALLGMGTMANAQFYVVGQDGTVLYKMDEGTPAYVTFENPNSYNGTVGTPVDLGLTSGTLWADHNVGATNVFDAGDYYQWGEVMTHYSAGGNTDNPTWKEGYSAGYRWSTYFDTNDGGNTFVKYKNNGGKIELEDADDVAVQTWGVAWKMPTKTQQDELRNECDWEWTSINGVNGYKVKSRVNDNFIFLPAAGRRWNTNLDNAGDCGYYWSRSLVSDYSSNAYSLYFNSDGVDWDNNDRYGGFSVRPVCPGTK